MAAWARRLPFLLLLALLLAPLATAGSVDDPELTDPSGDAGDATPANYSGIDVLKAWVETETAGAIVVSIQMAGDVAEGNQQSFSYRIAIDHAGGGQFIPVELEGAVPSVGSVEGDTLTVSFQKNGFTGLRPGDSLTGLRVFTNGTTGLPSISSASDRAPDVGAAAARSYVVGSQAEAGVDFDGDGLDDRDELQGGTDPARADPDLDGLNDAEELALGTDPSNPDSDGDGLSDGDEVDLGTDPLDPDSDKDGLTDGAEIGTHGSDPLSADSDNDGVLDADEVRFGTDPSNEDTDGDGVSDRIELDDDRLDPKDGSDGRADPDGDGVSTADEIAAGTDPFASDEVVAGDGFLGFPWWVLIVAAVVLLVLITLLVFLLARRSKDEAEDEDPQEIHEVEEVSELDGDEPFVLSKEYLQEGLSDEDLEAARRRFMEREQRFWDNSAPSRDRSHDTEDLPAPWDEPAKRRSKRDRDQKD